jgi:mycothiol synthase
MTADDVEAWARLLADVEAVDRTGEHYTAADLAEEMANPEVEDLDFIGAFQDGELVGFASVLPRGPGDGAFKVAVEGAVRPERRGAGIGTSLAKAMIARARQVAKVRRPDLATRVVTHALASNRCQCDLLTSVGFRPGRSQLLMRRSLDDLPEPPAPADGYLIREYDASRADDLRLAHNLAFDGFHPGFVPWTAEVWAQWESGSRTFRPALSRLAVPDGSDEIVGYLTTHEFEGNQQATGRREAHVAKLGTVPSHRGHGLAAALLGHCLRAYADAGYDDASLNVDADNPTGARRVYERAGFRVERESIGYALDLVDS